VPAAPFGPHWDCELELCSPDLPRSGGFIVDFRCRKRNICAIGGDHESTRAASPVRQLRRWCRPSFRNYNLHGNLPCRAQPPSFDADAQTGMAVRTVISLRDLILAGFGGAWWFLNCSILRSKALLCLACFRLRGLVVDQRANNADTPVTNATRRIRPFVPRFLSSGVSDPNEQKAAPPGRPCRQRCVAGHMLFVTRRVASLRSNIRLAVGGPVREERPLYARISWSR